jgi:hypothetical protein
MSLHRRIDRLFEWKAIQTPPGDLVQVARRGWHPESGLSPYVMVSPREADQWCIIIR